jgi:hypothetical protein
LLRRIIVAIGTDRTFRDVCYLAAFGAKRTSVSDCVTIATYEYTPNNLLNVVRVQARRVATLCINFTGNRSSAALVQRSAFQTRRENDADF